MSYEHAWVAEMDGHPAGIAVGFPCASRYRLHFGLLRQGVRHLTLARKALVPLALAWLVAASPRPPQDAFYGAAIAVNRSLVRRGIATALLDSMRDRAAEAGHAKLVGHTGVRHIPMRSTLERYGFRGSRARSWGYVLYELDLTRKTRE
jgi:GNAT superfamily N-acetyltransferase